MSFKSDLMRYITANEGYRYYAYQDTVGIPTIGVGFNLERKDAKEKLAQLGYDDWKKMLEGEIRLSDETINELLSSDVNDVLAEAPGIVDNFPQLDDARRMVVADMIFNLGNSRFSGFKKTIRAIEANDWTTAGNEMQNSKWARQVGNRAKRNIEAMKTGILIYHGMDDSGDFAIGKEEKPWEEASDEKKGRINIREPSGETKADNSWIISFLGFLKSLIRGK